MENSKPRLMVYELFEQCKVVDSDRVKLVATDEDSKLEIDVSTCHVPPPRRHVSRENNHHHHDHVSHVSHHENHDVSRVSHRENHDVSHREKNHFLVASGRHNHVSNVVPASRRTGLSEKSVSRHHQHRLDMTKTKVTTNDEPKQTEYTRNVSHTRNAPHTRNVTHTPTDTAHTSSGGTRIITVQQRQQPPPLLSRTSDGQLSSSSRRRLTNPTHNRSRSFSCRGESRQTEEHANSSHTKNRNTSFRSFCSSSSISSKPTISQSARNARIDEVHSRDEMRKELLFLKEQIALLTRNVLNLQSDNDKLGEALNQIANLSSKKGLVSPSPRGSKKMAASPSKKMASSPSKKMAASPFSSEERARGPIMCHNDNLEGSIQRVAELLSEHHETRLETAARAMKETAGGEAGGETDTAEGETETAARGALGISSVGMNDAAKFHLTKAFRAASEGLEILEEVKLDSKRKRFLKSESTSSTSATTETRTTDVRLLKERIRGILDKQRDDQCLRLRDDECGRLRDDECVRLRSNCSLASSSRTSLMQDPWVVTSLTQEDKIKNESPMSESNDLNFAFPVSLSQPETRGKRDIVIPPLELSNSKLPQSAWLTGSLTSGDTYVS